MKTREEKERLCNVSLYEYLKGRPEDKRFLFTEDREWSAKECADIVESLAERMYVRGIWKGSLVALRATRCVDTVFILLALHVIGAVSVLTDAHEPVKKFLDESRVDISPDFYITNEDACGGISAGGDWILRNRDYADICPVTFEVTEGHTDAWARETASHVAPTDPTMIVFTSGSTGKSKAVLLCQKNYVSNSVDGGELFNSGRGSVKDSVMLVLPLHHIFGISLIVCALVINNDIMIPADSSCEAALANISRYKISVLYAVPTYLLSMAGNGNLEDYDLSSMAYAVIAGGPSSVAQAEYIEDRLHVRLIHVYGMTEFLGVTASPYDASYEYRCAGVGGFYPMNEGFIMDENGNTAAQGEEGEIVVRGNPLMLGYYNDPDETARAIDKDGYLHTGDMGFLDTMGVVHISGRKKDIIIRGGNNLSAGKIEDALMSLPCVRQAVVGAGKDGILGEVPCAAVMPANGYNVTEEMLKGELAAKLTKIEMPVRILIMDEFPLTSSGKPDRVCIKEMLRGI